MKVLVLAGAGCAQAVQIALRLGEVTVLEVLDRRPEIRPNPARRDHVGVGQSLRLCDEVLFSRLQDITERLCTLTSVLAAATRTYAPEIVIVPEDSSVAVGPLLAEELDWPHVTGVVDAQLMPNLVVPTEQDLLVKRLVLRGIQRLRGPAKAVLSVWPSMRPASTSSGGAESRRKSVESQDINLSSLGLCAEDLQRPLLRATRPERRSLYAGKAFDTVEDLAERLRQDGLVVSERRDLVVERDS